MARGRDLAVVVGTAVVLTLAACASATDPDEDSGMGSGPVPAGAPSSPAPEPVLAPPPASASALADVAPASLSAAVVQYRRDAQRDVLQVKVTNHGPSPVHVTHVRLDTTTFAAPVEVDKDSRIGPGAAADLTVALGEAACSAPRADGGQHVVTLTVDGAVVVLPVGGDVLGPVADERCLALSVQDHVVLAVGPGWSDAGEVRGEPALRGTVVATPQPGSGELRVSVQGATTLLTVADPSTVVLPAGAVAPVSLDLLLSVTRCDPHAVAEDKKGYLMPVRVSVDGGAEVLVEVAVPVVERAPLDALVDRTCG